ncbi:MAG TPA: hemolysin family protein [Afifellaceae bacterium]|nr:hemolysin family protein [Afifellaceae bacterium]
MTSDPSSSSLREPDPDSRDTDSPNLLSGLTTTLRNALRLRTNGSARTEIEDALAEDEARGAAFSAFSPEERAMLRAILRLGDMRVEDVMVPRADIDAVELNVPIAGVMVAFRKSGHSRMPVFRETLDDPVGMVHIKDLMTWIFDTAGGKSGAELDQAAELPNLTAVDLGQALKRTGIVRPLLFVPPSMPARMLLEQMQASRRQMALVIDEYGGTDGLVCLEDLVEIIVGEIEDEHDLAEEADIVKVADGQYVADARADLDEARALIGPAFDVAAKEDVDTIGGLIFSAIGRIPVRGEIVHALEGFEFEILDADPRRIKRVRIRERRKPKAIQRARAKAAEAGPIPGEAAER